MLQAALAEQEYVALESALDGLKLVLRNQEQAAQDTSRQLREQNANAETLRHELQNAIVQLQIFEDRNASLTRLAFIKLFGNMQLSHSPCAWSLDCFFILGHVLWQSRLQSSYRHFTYTSRVNIVWRVWNACKSIWWLWPHVLGIISGLSLGSYWHL